jgi:nucleoside-diphosphate-sugar epimerase
MIKKKFLGILGSKGFVGSSIVRYCKNNKIQFIGITRKNNIKYKNFEFKFLINCAMPSKRYWAKKFPSKDYDETVRKTNFFLKQYTYKKIIQVSSVSARVQLDTIYGKNKKKAENLIKKVKNFTIFRLASMYGKELSKGVLIDLSRSSTVFLNKNSKYSFTHVDKIAEFIITKINQFKNKTVEIGCNDCIQLGDIKKKIGSKSKFKGEIDNQVLKYNKANNFFGSSKDVFIFLKKTKSK